MRSAVSCVLRYELRALPSGDALGAPPASRPRGAAKCVVFAAASR
jgi:hypothetical protein